MDLIVRYINVYRSIKYREKHFIKNYGNAKSGCIMELSMSLITECLSPPKMYVVGDIHTHTNLKSRRTDLQSRSLGANPKGPRGQAQKGGLFLEICFDAYEFYAILDHIT